MAATTTPVPPPQQPGLMNTGLHLPDGANPSPVALAQAQVHAQAQRTTPNTPTPVPVPLPAYTTAPMVSMSPVAASPGIMTPGIMTPVPLTPGAGMQQHQILQPNQLQQNILMQQQAQLQMQNGSLPPTPHQATPILPGAMAPPARPVGKDKEEDYDPTDSLAGTGVDLKAEDAFLAESMALSKDRNSYFPLMQNGTPGGTGGGTHPVGENGAQVPDHVYNEAVSRWEKTNVHEMSNPFLSVANLHYRANKLVSDQGLTLNLEQKVHPQAPKSKIAFDVEPEIKTTTQILPDSTNVMATHTSAIPVESNLADQMALLSLAAKYRVRTLLEDAVRIARNRQTSSHGEVPDEWQLVAAEVKPFTGDTTYDEAGNPIVGSKRPLDTSKPHESGPPSKIPKFTTNAVIQTVREAGRAEREWEERRLRRRMARINGTTETTAAPSRAASVAPGASTPQIAPEKKEIPAKKEPKRGSKMAEASHASQNMTSSMFAGLGGSGLFGKKRKGKTYDWMNAGGGGGSNRNGASSAGKSTTTATTGAPAPLTTDTGRNRLGTWREDKEKGKQIQLRDWVAVLTDDGLDSQGLQSALNKLDSSAPR